MPAMLGANMFRLREEQELSKADLHRMTGISRPTLDKMEKGVADARLSYVQRMADAFCVYPFSLLAPPNAMSGLYLIDPPLERAGYHLMLPW